MPHGHAERATKLVTAARGVESVKLSFETQTFKPKNKRVIKTVLFFF